MNILKTGLGLLIVSVLLLTFTSKPARGQFIGFNSVHNFHFDNAQVSQSDLFDMIEMEALEFIDDDIIDSIVKTISIVSLSFVILTFIQQNLRLFPTNKQRPLVLLIRSHQSYLQVFKI